MKRISTAPQRGFTMVEILVGMVIGLLGMVVMMQVFLNAESTKRTTGGTGDAQTNGASALFALQRDIRQAGYGVTALNLMGCNVLLRAGVTLNVMAPLTINHAGIPAGDAATDTLLLVSGSSAGTPEGDVIILQPSTTTYSVTAPTSFSVGDWLIAEASTRPSPCSLTAEQILTRTTSPPNLTVTTGVAGIANGTLFNLGSAPRILAYAVRNQNLTVCDYMSSNCGSAALVDDASVWAPIANGIVSLRAQYGRDTTAVPMDAQVDVWDQITPGSAADVSGFVLNCAISRVQAARIAIVTRNGNFEREIVTNTTAGSGAAAAPTWAGNSGAPITLSGLTDWQHYRYRAYQAVVPLRNVVSLGAQAGC